MKRTYNGIRENSSRNTHHVAANILLEDSQIQRVLDLPCGRGAFAKRLLDKGLEVYTADCVNLIEIPDARFQNCDMNMPLPYESGTFDAVACIDGIAHIERQFDFIRECSRILRHGGVLVISTPNISSLRSRWRWFITGFHNKRKTPLNEEALSPEQLINIISFHDLRYLLHTNGFRIQSIRMNRIKTISWLYAPLIPLCFLLTRRVFHREEKDPEQRRRNREILRQMFSREVLFGETLIVKAVRHASENRKKRNAVS